jgi:hypothetical protein
LRNVSRLSVEFGGESEIGGVALRKLFILLDQVDEGWNVVLRSRTVFETKKAKVVLGATTLWSFAKASDALEVFSAQSRQVLES